MLPLETIFAVFPEVARRDRSLRPLSLAHATALEAMGINTQRDIPADSALLAATILSADAQDLGRMLSDGKAAKEALDGVVARMKRDGVTLEELSSRVNAVMDAAYLQYVPGGKDGNVHKTTIAETGYGWTLEYADLVCHEYGWDFDRVMTMPLSQVFALVACARTRNGGKAGGPDYYERIASKAIKRMRMKKAREKEAGRG